LESRIAGFSSFQRGGAGERDLAIDRGIRFGLGGKDTGCGEHFTGTKTVKLQLEHPWDYLRNGRWEAKEAILKKKKKKPQQPETREMEGDRPSSARKCIIPFTRKFRL